MPIGTSRISDEVVRQAYVPLASHTSGVIVNQRGGGGGGSTIENALIDFLRISELR